MDAGRSDAELTAQETQALRTLTMVCGAIMGSCVLLAAVAYGLTASGAAPPPGAVDPTVPNVLLAAALVPLLSSSIARTLLLRRSTGPTSVPRWFAASLVSFALREAAAVVGFVVSVLTHEPVWSAALSGMALMGMGLSFPTRQRYLDWRKGL